MSLSDTQLDAARHQVELSRRVSVAQRFARVRSLSGTLAALSRRPLRRTLADLRTNVAVLPLTCQLVVCGTCRIAYTHPFPIGTPFGSESVGVCRYTTQSYRPLSGKWIDPVGDSVGDETTLNPCEFVVFARSRLNPTGLPVDAEWHGERTSDY